MSFYNQANGIFQIKQYLFMVENHEAKNFNFNPITQK